MPYRIRKAPNRDLYWVVGEDGKHHSKEPIPLERAKKQMAALHIAMKGGEYPVPEPEGPVFFDTVQATAYNQKQADEYKAQEYDPLKRQRFNKQRERDGKTATDKDYEEFLQMARDIRAKRVAANPTYTPAQLAEQKKRDYEYAKWQEKYKKWKVGADAYYRQHPDEKMVIPPIDAKGNVISLVEGRKLPKITQGEAARRVAAYKESNKSGWEKFGDSIMSVLTGVTDKAVGLAADVVPGYGKALEVGYKTFAPPGSEYYKEGSFQDKIMSDLPGNIASAMGAGKKKSLTGGVYVPKPQRQPLVNMADRLLANLKEWMEGLTGQNMGLTNPRPTRAAAMRFNWLVTNRDRVRQHLIDFFFFRWALTNAANDAVRADLQGQFDRAQATTFNQALQDLVDDYRSDEDVPWVEAARARVAAMVAEAADDAEVAEAAAKRSRPEEGKGRMRGGGPFKDLVEGLARSVLGSGILPNAAAVSMFEDTRDTVLDDMRANAHNRAQKQRALAAWQDFVESILGGGFVWSDTRDDFVTAGRVHSLPSEGPSRSVAFPAGSTDAIGDDFEDAGGVAYLMTPHGEPQVPDNDFLTRDSAEGLLRTEGYAATSGPRGREDGLRHPKTRAFLTDLTPVTFTVSERVGKGRVGRVSSSKKSLKGSGLPDKNLLQQMASASYKTDPPSSVGHYQLVRSTPGVKFYKNTEAPEIIVAVKGTKDYQDYFADVAIPFQNLSTTQRFKQDLDALKDFQRAYPMGQYTYYGVGHSLGGAILDEFLKEGLLLKAVSYNPAIQTGDIRRTDIDNQRIYKQGDFLYKLQGQFSMSPEVRSKTMLEYLGSFLNPLDPFTSHTLDNFVGGRRPATKFQNQLKRAKVSPEAYLKAAQAKAKKQGLAWKHIGFSSDEKHKLQVPNAQGKMVRFGSVGQGDHILYTLSHDASADEHRKRYLARATKIKGEWKSDPYSPNSLAIHVLW